LKGQIKDQALPPHVNPREFKTELEAVWFAANYYFAASFKARSEFGGVVFRKPNGKFGITIRTDGVIDHIDPRLEDVPGDCETMALWHTHLPIPRLRRPLKDQATARTVERIDTLIGTGQNNFSGDDKALADAATEAMKKITGDKNAVVPAYLVTDKLIKRYTPDVGEESWDKEPPAHFHPDR
jgi:hypothetical protein